MNGICLNWQRVGTHPLRPLPLRCLHDAAWASVLGQHYLRIANIVEPRLQAHGIPFERDEDMDFTYYDNPKEPDYLDYCGWSITSRYNLDAPCTSYVTVLIAAPWDETMADTWCKAAFEIKHHLDCEMLWSFGIDVKVEIIAPELLKANHFAPVTGREDLDRDWGLIRATVRRKIERYERVRMAWNCIALFSHGIYEKTTRNPPTVYITMARTCAEYEWNWDLREDIQEYLDQSGHGLKLHIEHCAIDSFGTMVIKDPAESPLSEDFDRLNLDAELDPYAKTVSMGAEFSASTDVVMAHPASTEECEDGIGLPTVSAAREAKFNPPVGTLGCYIEVQGGDGHWKSYALANYHTIRPAKPGFRCNARGDLLQSGPGSELRRIDKEGLRPNDQISIAIESPARFVHQKRIEGLKKVHEIRQEPEWHTAMAEKCDFLEQGKHILGHLHAASGAGYGKDGAFLDWALIDVMPERMGTNQLPDRETWPAKLSSHTPPPGLVSLGQPADLYGDEVETSSETAETLSIEQIGRNQKMAREAYQFGAMGNRWTGEVSRHKAAVRWEPDDVLGTTEAVFVRKHVPKLMLRPDSDSGSVLYNWKGRALGMLLGTRQPRQDEGAFFFVTPMEDVLGHIAFMLGVERSSVRIAEL